MKKIFKLSLNLIRRSFAVIIVVSNSLPSENTIEKCIKNGVQFKCFNYVPEEKVDEKKIFIPPIIRINNVNTIFFFLNFLFDVKLITGRRMLKSELTNV